MVGGDVAAVSALTAAEYDSWNYQDCWVSVSWCCEEYEGSCEESLRTLVGEEICQKDQEEVILGLEIHYDFQHL